jgi:C-terminal peptidase prc
MQNTEHHQQQSIWRVYKKNTMHMRRVYTWVAVLIFLLLFSWLAACDSVPVVILREMQPAATPTSTATSIAVAARSSSLEPLPSTKDAPEATATATASPTRRPSASATPTRKIATTPTPSPPPESRKHPAAALTPTSAPSPTPLTASGRQQVFEKVWQIIDEHYLYADFHGVNWDDTWHEFAPRVAAAESNEEFYALMTEMVNLLGDHHSRFLAPHDAVEESAMTVGQEVQVGIGVITRPTSDGVIIQHVLSGSPAAQAGLRPRDRIVAVDGAPFTVDKDITGVEGTRVRLTVERPNDQMHDVVLTRQHVEGRIAPTVRWMSGNIGYLAVPTLWVNDMDDQVSGALTDLVVEKSLNGLILDLRGNPGGWRDVLTSVLSHFVQGEAGVFFDRQGASPLIIHESSGPDLRDLPLVVLIDQGTSSYAEVLAAVLQVEAEAYVIGMPSAGNTETIYAYELPDGARLWVAQEGFRLRNGMNLEGEGVQPDHIIAVDWTRYSEEQDPYILAALRHLRSP